MGSPAWERWQSEFLSRMSFQRNPTIDKSIREQMVSQIKRREDIVNISGAGMRLLIDGKKPEDNWEQVTDGGANETLKVVDKFISTAGKLLKQMKEIAASAVDKSLDDEERMEKQLEMGRLQHQINIETDVMGGILAGHTEAESRAWALDGQGSFFQSGTYKMLERAYDRMVGGEDWDVAELYVPILEHHPDLPELWVSEHVWEVTDNEDVPTVGEILKINSRSVMDPKAARVSEKELDKDLKKLAASKRSLVTFVEKNGDDPQDSYVVESMSLMAHATARVLSTFCKIGLLVTYGEPKRKDEEGNIVPLEIEITPELEAKNRISSFPEETVFINTGNTPVRDDSIMELSALLEALDKQVIPPLQTY
jgi:hypothetical protein